MAEIAKIGLVMRETVKVQGRLGYEGDCKDRLGH